MSEEAEKTKQVIYRLTEDEYNTFSRIADMLHKNGSLKVNTVNALAKAAAFTQINIFLGFEAKEHAFKEWQSKEKEKEKELTKRNIPYPQGFERLSTGGL